MARIRNSQSRTALYGREDEYRLPDREDEYRLPPRRTIHPSERERAAKWFVNALFVLLLLLLASLTYWGFHLYTPTGS